MPLPYITEAVAKAISEKTTKDIIGTKLNTYRDEYDVTPSRVVEYTKVVDAAKAHKIGRDSAVGAYGEGIPDNMLITAEGVAALIWEFYQTGPCLIAGTKITMNSTNCS